MSAIDPNNTHKDLTVIIDKDAASYLIPAFIPAKQVALHVKC